MLYSPASVGRLSLPNRLVLPPMHSGTGVSGEVTPATVEHYVNRAAGSHPGLIIVEHSYIREDGRADSSQLSIAEDARIDGHRRLTDAVHAQGCSVILQLNHAGSQAEPSEERQPVSAGALPSPRIKHPVRPRPLTVEEIRDLEDCFAQAALRAMQAGYDGVELHCAHGYLLNQFYSPLTNPRTDEYGADSVENRCRFTLETLAWVRKTLGAEVPIAVRLGGCDYLEGGSTEEDAVAASRLLEAAGADLLDLSGGMCGFILPDRPEPGTFSTMTEKVRAAVSVPVLLTGGVTTPAQAEALLRDGKADLIGVGRALFRDPDWGKR